MMFDGGVYCKLSIYPRSDLNNRNHSQSTYVEGHLSIIFHHINRLNES
jgi:hypothetical protein